MVFPLQRYQYYVLEGVPQADLPPMPERTMTRVQAKLKKKLLENPNFKSLRQELHQEIIDDYHCSLKKAIIDYILEDGGEMKRLKIGSLPQALPRRAIRAPVPWEESMRNAKEAQSQQLFISNTVMTELHNLWHSK